MAVNFSYRCVSQEFDGTTYNDTTGGVKRIQYSIRGEPLRDWVGTNNFNTFLAVVNWMCWLRLTLREVKNTKVIGTKDTSMASLLSIKGDSVTMTFVNMILYGIEGDQGTSDNGSCVLDFGHESGNGTDAPMS